MTTRRTVVLLFAFGVTFAAAGLAVACGTSSNGPVDLPDAAADATSEADDDDAAQGDASSATDAFVVPAECPSAQPIANGSCTGQGLWCEYGDGGNHSTCTTTAHCDVMAKSGNTLVWHVTPPNPSTCGAQPADCPAAFGEPADAACPSQGSCDYAEGRCACVVCDDYDGSPEQNQWLCRAWSDVPSVYTDGGSPAPSGSCATDRARLGTTCTDPTIICGYDACNGISIGPYTWCQDGKWSVGPQTDSCNHPGCR